MRRDEDKAWDVLRADRSTIRQLNPAGAGVEPGGEHLAAVLKRGTHE